jgi:hypothetical protein
MSSRFRDCYTLSFLDASINNNQAFYSQASWGMLEMKPHERKKKGKTKSDKKTKSKKEKTKDDKKTKSKKRKDNKTLSQKAKKGQEKKLDKRQ